ncbi:hypothetical protein VTJ83DRAFT_926 [Remersonia thermophila]|uniref:Thioredoxin domain-containing protein n=1 Tax=Remersonia thermophila TaxID=72144 RepID=A0ABR4DMN9_9PEZI
MLFPIPPRSSQEGPSTTQHHQHQQQQQQHQQQQQEHEPPHQDPQDQEAVIPIPQPGDPAPPLYPPSTVPPPPGPSSVPLTPSGTPIVTFPRATPVLAVFLRHCGCPFAEKTFRRLADVANKYRGAVTCIAVSQAARDVTDKWIIQVGGAWEVQVVADPRRELFRAWGLGLASSTWYAWNPKALWSAWKLGTDEGIWTRDTAAVGGNKWQISGAFAIDAEGVVRWSKPGTQSADELPDFGEALRALGMEKRV